jgi:hypothetical protein
LMQVNFFQIAAKHPRPWRTTRFQSNVGGASAPTIRSKKRGQRLKSLA